MKENVFPMFTEKEYQTKQIFYLEEQEAETILMLKKRMKKMSHVIMFLCELQSFPNEQSAKHKRLRSY